MWIPDLRIFARLLSPHSGTGAHQRSKSAGAIMCGKNPRKYSRNFAFEVYFCARRNQTLLVGVLGMARMFVAVLLVAISHVEFQSATLCFAISVHSAGSVAFVVALQSLDLNALTLFVWPYFPLYRRCSSDLFLHGSFLSMLQGELPGFCFWLFCSPLI